MYVIYHYYKTFNKLSNHHYCSSKFLSSTLIHHTNLYINSTIVKLFKKIIKTLFQPKQLYFGCQNIAFFLLHDKNFYVQKFIFQYTVNTFFHIHENINHNCEIIFSIRPLYESLSCKRKKKKQFPTPTNNTGYSMLRRDVFEKL